MLPLVGWPPRCLLRAAVGVPCPFCGMTTGVLATLRGDASAAFAANPAAPLVALALVAIVVVRLARLVRLSAFRQSFGPWIDALPESAGRLTWRWRWPALAGLWLFELHRFASR